MLPLTICLLLITQSFAHDTKHHSSQHRHKHVSTDATNKNTDRDWTIPDSKLIYNYEQMRRDQPAQIEQRAEDVIDYMNQNSPTTTTSTTTTEASDEPQTIGYLMTVMNKDAPSIQPQGFFNNPIIVLHAPRRHHRHRHHHSKNSTKLPIPTEPEKQEVVRPHFPTHSWDNWNYQSAYPSKMPPPPSLPKWEDLNTIMKKHSHHKHETDKSKPQNISSFKLQEEPTTTESTKIDTNLDTTPQPSNLSQDISMPSNQDQSTTTQPMKDDVKLESSLEKKPQYIFRGNHKFSKLDWNDVSHDTQAPSSTTTTTTSAPIVESKSPPPVPTLSPWYDGFGK